MTYIPKSYKIEEVIFKHAKGELDVTAGFTKIEIEEDIYSDSLKSKIIVPDVGDAFNKVDFDGTETYELTFESPGDKQVSIVFQVYKIEVTPDPNYGYGKIYEMFGVTPEHYTQSTMDVSKGYTSQIDSAVKDVFGMIGSSRPLSVHPTNGVDRFVIPGMTPYETMVFLARRAMNATFTSSLFTFYESLDGFNFHNIEQLIKENKGSPIEYIFSPDAKVEKGDPKAQFYIEQLTIDANKDIMSRIKSGSYANQCKEIDLINQTVHTFGVLVKDNFGDFVHLDKTGDAMTFDSKAMIDRHLNINNSTKWVNKTIGDPMFDNNFGKMIPRRRFYMDSLNGVQMRLLVPGNSNMMVGKVIDLNMLETTANTETKEQEQKVSGNYLVTRVFHMIDRKEYNMVMVLNKESYRANIDDPSKNVVA